MGPRPPGTSIDRKNNDGGYCKRNCKWSTRKEQNTNQRPRKPVPPKPAIFYSIRDIQAGLRLGFLEYLDYHLASLKLAKRRAQAAARRVRP